MQRTSIYYLYLNAHALHCSIVLLGLVLGVVGSQIVEAEISFNEQLESKTRKAIDKAFTKTRHGRSRLGTNQQRMSNAMKSNDSLSSLDSVEEDVESSHIDSSIYQHHQKHHDASQNEFPGLVVFYSHLPGLIPMIIGAILMALLEKWKWYDAIYFSVVTR